MAACSVAGAFVVTRSVSMADLLKWVFATALLVCSRSILNLTSERCKFQEICCLVIPAQAVVWVPAATNPLIRKDP